MLIRDVVLNGGGWHHVDHQSPRGSAIAANYAALPKKSTNVSLAESLLAEAKHLGINVSQAAEAGLAKAVADMRAKVWLEENAEAIDSSNQYVEKHGLPLPQFGMF